MFGVVVKGSTRSGGDEETERRATGTKAVILVGACGGGVGVRREIARGACLSMCMWAAVPGRDAQQ